MDIEALRDEIKQFATDKMWISAQDAERLDSVLNRLRIREEALDFCAQQHMDLLETIAWLESKYEYVATMGKRAVDTCRAEITNKEIALASKPTQYAITAAIEADPRYLRLVDEAEQRRQFATYLATLRWGLKDRATMISNLYRRVPGVG